MIQRCWEHKPDERPNFSEICTELRYLKGLLLRGPMPQSPVDDGHFGYITKLKKKTRGVSHCGLAIYIKECFKAKQENL